METRFAYVLIVLLLALTGCNSASSPGEPLVGAWQRTGPEDAVFLMFLSERVEFHEDGAFYAPGRLGGTYTVLDDGRVQIAAPLAGAPDASAVYSFELAGDRLTVTSDQSDVMLTYERTGPPSDVLPPTLRPGPSPTPS